MVSLGDYCVVTPTPHNLEEYGTRQGVIVEINDTYVRAMIEPGLCVSCEIPKIKIEDSYIRKHYNEEIRTFINDLRKKHAHEWYSTILRYPRV